MPATPDTMQSNTHRFLANALTLFEDIAPGREKVSVKTLAERHGLSYASCYRIVSTFREMGWLQVDDAGVYKANPDLIIKLDGQRAREFIISVLSDSLRRLVERTELTVKMTAREGEEAFSFFTLASPKPNSIFSKKTSRFHLAAGSSGSCLLSDLSDNEIRRILKHAPDHYWKRQNEFDALERVREAREYGVAFDLGTTNPHVNAASVPLRWTNGKVAAAVTTLGFPTDFETDRKDMIRRELLAISESFDQALRDNRDDAHAFAI